MPDFTKQGPSGGMVGTQFTDDVLDSEHRLKQIRIWAGVYVSGIQIEYEDQNGATHELGAHGGTGAPLQLFSLDDDEYIVGVRGRAGLWLDSIMFETNKQTSVQFGGPGGTANYSYRASGREEVIGFHGLEGSQADYVSMIPGASDLAAIGITSPFSGPANLIMALGVIFRPHMSK